MKNDIFTKTYLNIIKEDSESEYFEFDKATGEFSYEYNVEGEGRYEGEYQGYLNGKVEGGTITYTMKVYNTSIEDWIDKEEGTKTIGEGQTANMILSNLKEEFKDFVNKQDITGSMASDEEMGIKGDRFNWR